MRSHIANLPDAGSSPRVRSRPVPTPCRGTLRGIISACAEQTLSDPFVVTLSGDHLRVCGADDASACVYLRKRGSSPRVRSRPAHHQAPAGAPGIISACAEQTGWRDCPPFRTRDHLRVCGADALCSCDKNVGAGSSPRVRSRPARHGRPRRPSGIISACAEQTTRGSASWRWNGDHLRVCGADHSYFHHCRRSAGSSPRVRSRRS